MDYTIAPVKPRSLVRRLVTWTATLSLFAGGGYGVYRYAAPLALASAEAPATAGAETPNDRLLAAMPGGSVTSARYPTPLNAASDRYGAAPALPPAPSDEEVATPRSAAAVDSTANPFATTPFDGYAGRYNATPPPAQAVAEPAPTDGAAATVAPDDAGEIAVTSDEAEVARGQEPQSTNPLRSATRPSSTAVRTDDSASEARAMFSADTLPPASMAAPTRVVSSVTSGTRAGAGFGTARGSGAAGGSAELTAADGPRYNPSTSATPGATAIVENEPATAAPSPATPLAAANPYMAAQSPYGASAPAESGAQAAFAAAAPLPSQAAVAPANPYGGAFSATDSAITPTPGLATADGTGRPGERILEGIQSPAITIQKLAPPEIQVGKRATFAVRVQNNSQRTAHGVQVLDEVPLGTQLIGTAPKASVSGAKVVWNLGTLSAGEERIVEMELMPTEEGELGSVATVSYSAQASATTRCTRPQLALRLTANPRVMIGDQQIVQIEVTNPGSGDATGVMLLESIPQGVTHEAGPALEFEVGTLRAGETKKMDLVLQADAAGMIDNIMTARGDANLQVQANCQFEVIAPELNLTVEGPAKRVLERPATYSISVHNPGTASAREVQLVTQLPKGMKYVSANNMGEYDAATHSVYWSLAELPANERGTVELTALAVEAGDQTLQFATRAQQGLEDRTEAHVMVEGIVALSFEVQDVEDAIEVGGETAYEIRVRNQGSKMATNVQVIAQMPAGLRAKAAQGDARFAIQGDRVVFAPLATLAPKADATFRFGVQGLRAGDQRVTLQVTTDEVRDPIVEVESTQVYADE